MPGANDYPPEELAARAAQTPADCIPTQEEISKACAAQERGRRGQNVILKAGDSYGGHRLTVCDSNLNVVEVIKAPRVVHFGKAVRIAKENGGLVFLSVDVYWGTVWIDEGYEIEIWPRLRPRPRDI